MAPRLVRAKYDRKSGRAYVEVRDGNGHRDEMAIAITFTFHTSPKLSEKQANEEVLRRARELLRTAAGFGAAGDLDRFAD